MRQQIDHERDHHDDEQQIEHKPPERQVERVKPTSKPNWGSFTERLTFEEHLDRRPRPCATRPASTPIATGGAIANHRMRLITVVRYRASGSGPIPEGTNTDRDR